MDINRYYFFVSHRFDLISTFPVQSTGQKVRNILIPAMWGGLKVVTMEQFFTTIVVTTFKCCNNLMGQKG